LLLQKYEKESKAEQKKGDRYFEGDERGSMRLQEELEEIRVLQNVVKKALP
jgi:hypothetical protein